MYTPPSCPPAERAGRDAARTVALWPEQGEPAVQRRDRLRRPGRSSPTAGPSRRTGRRRLDAGSSPRVVHNPETLHRFQEAVAPATALTDQSALKRIFDHWRLRDAPEDGPPFTKPVLILAGRQDSMVGYADTWRLVEHYPRATFAVLDRAGHALPHEQVTLLIALMAEWLDRVQEYRSTE